MEDKDTIFSDIGEEQVEATYFQKLFYGLIDTVVYILIIILMLKFLPREITAYFIGSIKTFITVAIIMAVYRLVCLLTLSRTLGMIVCKLKYLNEKFQPLSMKEKLITAILFKAPSVKYYKA